MNQFEYWKMRLETFIDDSKLEKFDLLDDFRDRINKGQLYPETAFITITAELMGPTLKQFGLHTSDYASLFKVARDDEAFTMTKAKTVIRLIKRVGIKSALNNYAALDTPVF